MWVPTPAPEGEKLLPVTPGPENVPPMGEPVIVTADAVLQYELANPEKEAVGACITLTVTVAVPVHDPVVPVTV